MMRLKGKVCVVTAAGQGIGAATARAFAREGATVWATDLDDGKLKALAGSDGVQIRKLDVLDKTETVKICTGYRYRGDLITDFPEDETSLLEAEPVYEEMSGWMTPTSGAAVSLAI